MIDGTGTLETIGADDNDWATLTMPADSDAINTAYQSAFFDYVSAMAGGYTMNDEFIAYGIELLANYGLDFYDYMDGKVVAAYIYAPDYSFSSAQSVGVCIYAHCGGAWLYYDSGS